MIDWLLHTFPWLGPWLGYRSGESTQAATDVKAGEETALKAEQQRKQSDAKIDADSNAADLEWLREHGTSSSGDKT